MTGTVAQGTFGGAAEPPRNHGDRGSVVALVEGAVATLTISRPGKRNALTIDMWQRVGELIPQLAADPSVRVILLRGAGGSFSAGADLNDVLAATRSPAAAIRYCRMIVHALATVATSAVPTIAVTEGVASGGGVELALAADNRIATTGSSFQLPFAALGVVPDALTLRRLTTTVGLSMAQWMVSTGRAVDAPTALRVGLVDDLVPPESLEAEIDDVVRTIAHADPRALLQTRMLLKGGPEQIDVARDAEQMAQSFLSGSVRKAALGFISPKPTS